MAGTIRQKTALTVAKNNNVQVLKHCTVNKAQTQYKT